jgi:hypothetical protein
MSYPGRGERVYLYNIIESEKVEQTCLRYEE